MKSLYVIGGTMGVGKTTVSQLLMKKLPDSVFLDGDWCWMSSPFQVTDETKTLVQDNICHILNNFLHCSAYKNVIFCWVMHQQSIIDAILSRLDTENCRVHSISLIADSESLTVRLEKDVQAGLREAAVIERSVARIPLYSELNTIKIDVSHMTASEAAEAIANL